ncbi:prepilin-type N-terminal cleavage/methylation domain-containing protein [Sulfitobacter sp. F26204]|uniref:prepilin-type N-terminal cleavage/methylation domain-containing protein n=1 Tax=Sulfitobacter sp. F26204 TaxID=2996014 RepID=UPI00225E28E1|nr:prepilin-type N-terminal cleavage/methylation domain-containing protein [Sulfitobacter sp. F26204]MCX7560521.1 prepilin-type N-terminal cleavage/methylation domain-containing protein [Sulfitobacter sp. F26204]
MTQKRGADAGISLIEVLVSLAIFAVIGIAGLAVLNTVARTGERTDGRLDRLAELDRAFLVISRDLEQVTMAEMALDAGMLAFHRTGSERDIEIVFLFDQSALVRRIESRVGGIVDQLLLTGVAGLQWRLMDRSKRWHESWPPAGTETPGRPYAAELTLDVLRAENIAPQRVTRLILLPAGQGR